MYTYDLTIVLDGKTTPAKKKSNIEKMEKLVESVEGKVGKVKDWGERDLAYTIGKSQTGIYLTFPVSMPGESAKKFNDKLRLEEGLLRYLLIRNGEEVEKPVKAKKSNGKKS